MARVMAEHYIGVERLQKIRRLVHRMEDPLAIVAELECNPEDDGS
jgi:helicase